MHHPNQFDLLKQRRFLPFFCTQFLGAANDNIFKFAFTLLVTFQAGQFSHSPSGWLHDSNLLTNLIAGLFILPFVLFSATSGQLADKLNKTTIMRGVKLLEIGIMLCACWSFWQHSVIGLLACTFLLGLHSTLFGPVKFAYLPQHLGSEELVGGNGLVEMGTFVAILLGTIVGGTLMQLGANGMTLLCAVLVGVAICGLLTSLLIPASPSENPTLAINWNPFSETWRTLQLAQERRVVFLSMLGISWLWFFGATFLTQFSNFAKVTLHGNEQVVTLLLAIFSIGIGLGSLLCEKLSGNKVEIGLVPFGSIGMSLFAIDLYFASRALPAQPTLTAAAFLAQTQHWRVMIDLFLLALFGGLYSVPLYALIQLRSQATHRARIIAANNILNAIFMIASAGVAVLCLSMLKLSIPQLFLVMAGLNALVAIYIYGLVPEFLIRFLAWLLIHSMYNLKKEGVEHLPEKGAALLVCNHVSFVDAVILMGISPRPIRFVMDHQIFKIPIMSWFFKHAKAIPIASAKVNPEMMERAFAEVSNVLKEGELVMIFPEGRITDTGDMYPFRPGMTRILQTDPVPVIPIALRGLWGSFFSRKYGTAMTRLRGVYSRIQVAVGQPVPAEQATPEYMQQKVAELRGDMR